MSEAIQFPEIRAKAAEQLADRYMALWNEPDELQARATTSHEHWVGSKGLSFLDGA